MKTIFGGIHCYLEFKSVMLPNMIYLLTKQNNTGEEYYDHLSQQLQNN